MYHASFSYVPSDFLARVFKATPETVTTIMAIPTEMSAALLNSGTFGVEVAPVEVVDEGVDVALEVPLDESDMTAMVPGVPAFSAKISLVPES